MKRIFIDSYAGNIVAALEKDGKTLADFPEKIDVEGTFIVKATKAEMQQMVDGTYNWGGSKKQDEAPAQEEPPRRRRRVSEDEEVF